LVKNRRSEPYPTSIWGPGWGLTSVEFCQRLWHRQTRIPGLSYGILWVILGLTIFVQLRLVTDGWTDRRTHDDSIYNANIALCGKTGKMDL